MRHIDSFQELFLKVEHLECSHGLLSQVAPTQDFIERVLPCSDCCLGVLGYPNLFNASIR
jgi:hypothetical protein